MFGIIGFAFGLLVGTSKFALRNVVRAAACGLVAYLVYELISGYSAGRAGEPAPEPPVDLPEPIAPDRVVLTGSSKQGRTVHVSDDSGIEHTTRVGRGVVRR